MQVIAIPTSTLSRPRPSGPHPLQQLLDRDWVVVAVAAVLAAAMGWMLIDDPGHVDLEFSNPTEYPITVTVDSPGDGPVTVTTVRPGAQHRIESVLDQGDTWIFRFTSRVHEAGALQVGRRDLDAAGWSLEIPVEAGERLDAQGVIPVAWDQPTG